MNNHKKNFHGEENKDSVKCNVCNKDYNSLDSYRRHFQAFHLDNKVECSFCKTSFQFKPLTSHQIKDHPWLKCKNPVIYELCPKKFYNFKIFNCASSIRA